MLAAALS